MPTPAHETMFEAWTTLAAISQQTSSIKLGQMVGCAPYRNPGLQAKITSNLDVMSGGRLIWGVGAGWYEHEFTGYGYEFPPAADRIRVLRETVEIVTAMWSEPDVDYEGKHFTLRGGQCDPKPLQQPRPQVLIGGGEQLTLVDTPEQVAEKIQTYIDFGCTGFYPWCSDYPDTETMRLFAEQVIPEVRRANP